MARQDVVLTYKEYEALPADGRRYEIHDGELSVTAAPSPQHQMVSLNLVRLLDQHVRTFVRDERADEEDVPVRFEAERAHVACRRRLLEVRAVRNVRPTVEAELARKVRDRRMVVDDHVIRKPDRKPRRVRARKHAVDVVNQLFLAIVQDAVGIRGSTLRNALSMSIVAT